MYKKKLQVFQETDNPDTSLILVFNKGQRSNTEVGHQDRPQGLLNIKYSTYKATMITVF